jgi:hypothetical protein
MRSVGAVSFPAVVDHHNLPASFCLEFKESMEISERLIDLHIVGGRRLTGSTVGDGMSWLGGPPLTLCLFGWEGSRQGKHSSGWARL